MKKLVLLGAMALFGGFAHAQEGFRLGGHVGAPLGDASDAASVTLGIDAAYMWNITKGLDIGAATGYSHFFGKDNMEDFGFIPLAVSGKYTFNKLPLFVGLDLGAAISTRNYINSGLYVAPRVGYQLNRKTELYLGFQNIGSKYKHTGPGPGPHWHGDDRFSFGAVNFGANFFLK